MIDTATRTRWSLVILIATLTVAACNAGVILLTHVNYQSWELVGVAEMDAVHRNWSTAVHWIILPLAAASGVGLLAMALVRHPRVPWWVIGLGGILQAATFILSFTTWARWQNQIGKSGLVRMPDGSLHPLYVRLMDTHWLRIALVVAFGLLVVGAAIAAVAGRSRVAARAAA